MKQIIVLAFLLTPGLTAPVLACDMGKLYNVILLAYAIESFLVSSFVGFVNYFVIRDKVARPGVVSLGSILAGTISGAFALPLLSFTDSLGTICAGAGLLAVAMTLLSSNFLSTQAQADSDS